MANFYTKCPTAFKLSHQQCTHRWNISTKFERESLNCVEVSLSHFTYTLIAYTAKWINAAWVVSTQSAPQISNLVTNNVRIGGTQVPRLRGKVKVC